MYGRRCDDDDEEDFLTFDTHTKQSAKIAATHKPSIDEYAHFRHRINRSQKPKAIRTDTNECQRHTKTNKMRKADFWFVLRECWFLSHYCKRRYRMPWIIFYCLLDRNLDGEHSRTVAWNALYATCIGFSGFALLHDMLSSTPNMIMQRNELIALKDVHVCGVYGVLSSVTANRIFFSFYLRFSSLPPISSTAATFSNGSAIRNVR